MMKMENAFVLRILNQRFLTDDLTEPREKGNGNPAECVESAEA